MSLMLVFPPGASPTYVPLGLGILAGAVRAGRGDRKLRVLDLNIEAWEYVLSRFDGGDSLVRFLRGREGDFFDPESYRQHAGQWASVKRQMGALAKDAARFVDTGELGGDFAILLARQVGEIAALEPDKVGISILFPGQVVFGLAVARGIRSAMASSWNRHSSLPGAPAPLRVVLGGAALSFLDAGDLLENCPYIDGIVLGEGEAAMEAWCRDEPIGGGRGAITRDGGGAGRLRPGSCPSLDALPPPDFQDLDLTRYLLPEPVLPVLSSRGCGWGKCRFCAHTLSFGPYRERSPDRVVEELELQQRRHGVRHFYFSDPYMDEDHLAAIARAILGRGLKIRFHCMAKPTAAFSGALFDLLARAGCRWISWGIESGSQRLLDLARKGTDVDVIRQVLWRSHDAGISNLLLLLFGMPDSTDEDLRQTLDLLDDVWDAVDSSTASTFLLYADAPFARRPERFGLLPTGQEILLYAEGRPIRWRRLNYKELSAGDGPRPPRGAIETDMWDQHRRWLRDHPFDRLLFAEHYLLCASRRFENRTQPALSSG